MKKFFPITLLCVVALSALCAETIIKNTGGGYMIGTQPAQKIGFWGTTQIVQPANTVPSRTVLETLGLVASGGSGTATASAGAATLSKVSGTITSEALTTAAAADYTLTLTNTLISATSIVTVTADNGTNTTEGMAVNRVTPGAGTLVVHVRNTHASVAWNGTIKLRYHIVQ